MKTIIDVDTFRKVRKLGYSQFSAFLNKIYMSKHSKTARRPLKALGWQM